MKKLKWFLLRICLYAVEVEEEIACWKLYRIIFFSFLFTLSSVDSSENHQEEWFHISKTIFAWHWNSFSTLLISFFFIYIRITSRMLRKTFLWIFDMTYDDISTLSCLKLLNKNKKNVIFFSSFFICFLFHFSHFSCYENYIIT